MSFNFITLSILLINLTLLTGCGVKSDPRPPKDTLLPSVESRYLRVPKVESKETKQVDKKKKSKNSNNQNEKAEDK